MNPKTTLILILRLDKQRTMVSSRFLFVNDQYEEKIDDGISRIILGYNEDLMLVKVKFDPGVSVVPHHHFHSQSSYIAKGSFEVTIAGETKTLREGDAFFISSDIEHSVISLEKSEIIDAFSPVREDFLTQ